MRLDPTPKPLGIALSSSSPLRIDGWVTCRQTILATEKAIDGMLARELLAPSITKT